MKTVLVSFAALWVLVVPQGARIGAFASADEVIEFDHALKIIQACEKRIQSVQWNCETAQGFFDDSVSPPKFTYKEGPAIGVNRVTRVVYEPWTGRYRVDIEGVFHVLDDKGNAPLAGGRMSFAFDGEGEQTFKWGKEGAQLPGIMDPRSGYIVPGKGTGFVPTGEGQTAGIGWFAPMFQHQLLSEGLKEAHARKPVRIVEDQFGIWHIDAKYAINGKPYMVKISYEPKRGGAVSDATWFGEDGKTTWQRYRYELECVQGEYWVPKELDILYPLNDNKFGIRIIYRDIKINEKITKDVFRIDFPAGTHVQDYVNRKTYRVGTTIETAQAQSQRFLKENELWVAEHPLPRNFGWVIALVGALAILLLGLIDWRLWQKKRRVIVRAAALAVALMATAPARADFVLDAGSNWVLREPNGQTRHIAHCGLNATLFTLECFQAKYNAKLVSAGLVPTDAGIRLSDVCAMLEVHGLAVNPRQSVTAGELVKALERGRLAIVPIKQRDKTNHYLVIQNHPERGILLVDPPYVEKSIDESTLSVYLAHFEGLAVLVGPAAPTENGPGQAASLSLSPREFTLGEFEIGNADAGKPNTHKVKVTNSGGRAVMVRQVLSSCGCITSPWEGGFLGPGESKDIELNVLRSAWGVGHLQRSVRLVMADDTRAAIHFQGTGLTSQAAQGLAFHPEIVRIQLDASSLKSGIIQRVVEVAKGPKQGSLQVSSENEWLKASVGEEKEGLTPLRLQIDFHPRLLAEHPQVSGMVLLRTQASASPVPLRVMLIKTEALRVTPFVSELSKRKDTRLELGSASNGAPVAGDVSLIAFSEPSGIDVTMVPGGSGNLSVHLTAGAKARSGYYAVHFATEKDGLRVIQATSVVRIVE